MSTAPMVPVRRRSTKPLRTLILGIALLALAIFGDDAYGFVTAAGKTPPELSAVDGPVHIVVQLGFEPERYHLERLSSLGSYAGRDGEQNRVRLLRVSQEHLTDISRLPWVEKIDPVVINS